MALQTKEQLQYSSLRREDMQGVRFCSQLSDPSVKEGLFLQPDLVHSKGSTRCCACARQEGSRPCCKVSV